MGQEGIIVRLAFVISGGANSSCSVARGFLSSVTGRSCVISNQRGTNHCCPQDLHFSAAKIDVATRFLQRIFRQAENRSPSGGSNG